MEQTSFQGISVRLTCFRLYALVWVPFQRHQPFIAWIYLLQTSIFISCLQHQLQCEWNGVYNLTPFPFPALNRVWSSSAPRVTVWRAPSSSSCRTASTSASASTTPTRTTSPRSPTLAGSVSARRRLDGGWDKSDFLEKWRCFGTVMVIFLVFFIMANFE